MPTPHPTGRTVMNKLPNLARLQDPFAPEDLGWRIQQAGRGRKSGQVYARVLVYLTSRAIQMRLDETAGPENWCNEFREGPAGGVLCGISIRHPETAVFVTKWDGCGTTQPGGGLSPSDAAKSCYSNALQRAATQWGIGRYLYHLPPLWADVCEDGIYRARLPQGDGGEWYRWNPPALPDWALPGGEGRPPLLIAA